MLELTLARAVAEFSQRLLCSSPYRHSYTMAIWSRNPRVPEMAQKNVVSQDVHRKLPACSFHKLQDVARRQCRAINEESALEMKTLCKEHRNLRSSPRNYAESDLFTIRHWLTKQRKGTRTDETRQRPTICARTPH